MVADGACRQGGGQYVVGMVSLTRREKEVVTFVIVAFLAGAGIKHWRDANPATSPASFAMSSR